MMHCPEESNLPVGACRIRHLSRILLAAVVAVGPRGSAAPPDEEKAVEANTRVLWLESDRVQSAWAGDTLQRVTDEETQSSCLEWFQDPATQAEVRLTLPGVAFADYDALCLEWKYEGGGSSLIVQAGHRNWYLFKEKYAPGAWHEAWLDMTLDDDRLGPRLRAGTAEEPLVALLFGILPQNRPEEQTWRRIRVKNIRLVKFPVRLTCDPKQVRTEADEASLRTVFPLTLSNATERTQTVQLSLDKSRLREFTSAFANDTVTLAPREWRTERLTFAIPRGKAAALPPLHFEETPVYAEVEGDPDSRTTWYRGLVRWMPGGVVPPASIKRPFMVKASTREKVLGRVQTHDWARRIHDNWIRTADRLATNAWVVPEIRHGYPCAYRCPEHGTPLKLDLIHFKRHYCAAGDHYVEGHAAIDLEAGITVHGNNSRQCRELGWAYHLTRDERYARKAAELLLTYAARFPSWTYSCDGSAGYRSRVGHAILGECWWVHGLNAGYDLIAGSPSLTDGQRRIIERDLFQIEAEDLQTHRVIMNQQAEVNGASAGAAVNAGNWYLAARAFTGDYGLFHQIDEAFSEEGFSRENDIAYHHAALHAIQPQGLIYEALGGTFFTPRVKRIYDAPLASSVNLKTAYPAFYEVAYARWRDPMYLPVLAGLRAGGGTADTLLEGVLPLPEGAASGELSSTSMDLAGRSVLRKGAAEDLRAVQIMWGSPTWRGGRDLLNYLVSFRGASLNTSVSRINYVNPRAEQAFSYCTLGGNVPEVDGLQQSGLRPRQTVFRGGDFPLAKYVAPPEASPYPGVALSRVIAIVGDVFVVIDRLKAGRPRRFTFGFYPGAMTVSNTPSLAFAAYPEFAAEGETYARLLSPERAACGNAFALEYPSGKLRTRARFLLDGEAELIQGVTFTQWHPVETRLFLARRHATAAACVTVIEAGAEAPPVHDLQVLPVSLDGREVPMHEGVAVALALPNGTVTLLDCDLPGVKRAGAVETDETVWVGRQE